MPTPEESEAAKKAADDRRAAILTGAGPTNDDEWKMWFDAQPEPVRVQLQRQAAELAQFGEFSERVPIVKRALSDERARKRLERLSDERFSKWLEDTADPIFDRYYGAGEIDLNGAQPAGGLNAKDNERLERIESALTTKARDDSYKEYLASRNNEFLALAREAPDLYGMVDPSEPDAAERNERAKKRAAAVVDLAEKMTYAEYRRRGGKDDFYYTDPQARVSLKQVMDRMATFRESNATPPPAITRTTPAGATAPKLAPAPPRNKQEEQDQMRSNLKRVGGFAAAARAGR